MKTGSVVVRRFGGRNSRRALAAGIAALALAATATTMAASVSAAPTVTVNFATQAIAQASWAKAVAEFEQANPNIKINAKYLPGDYGGLLKTQINAGNIPDVFYTAPGNGASQSLLPFVYRKGLLMNLKNEAFVKRIPAFVKPLVSTSKGVYSWPGDINILALWYNRPGLRALGIKPPETFPELLTLCRKVSAAGKIPVALATVPSNSAGTLIAVAGTPLKAMAPAWMKARKKGQTTFAASAGWRGAADSVLKMKSANCFSPGVASSPIQQVFGQLATGQALIYAGASQILNGVFPLIKDRSAVDFNGVPFPGAKKGQGAVLLTPNDGLSVWVHSKVRDAALTFVRYLADTKNAARFAASNGNADLEGFEKNKLPGFMSGILPAVKNKQTQLNPASIWPNPRLREALGTTTIGLLTGQKTTAQTLADLDRTYSEG